LSHTVTQPADPKEGTDIPRTHKKQSCNAAAVQFGHASLYFSPGNSLVINIECSLFELQ